MVSEDREDASSADEEVTRGTPEPEARMLNRGSKRVSAGLPADLLTPSPPRKSKSRASTETLEESSSVPVSDEAKVEGEEERECKEEVKKQGETKAPLTTLVPPSHTEQLQSKATLGAESKSSPDVPRGASSWKDLLTCLLLIGLTSIPGVWFTYTRLNQGPLKPKSAAEAGISGFSEERAMRHVVALATDIGFRQEGTRGLVSATEYLLRTVTAIQASASPRMQVEVCARDDYSGSFNIVFLHKSMTMGYQNLSNVVVRVSGVDSPVDVTPSVLVNGHYDSAIASQGAADCASCVATMLESLRQIVEGDMVPPSPLVFLMNGGEEIFLKASHGFLMQHPWSDTIGAFVNLEAAGTRLPDLLVQSGAPWVQRVYGETVPHPMASVIAQDIFPLIPGDTDWRILARDFSDIPGLDIMLTLNGYAYHTRLDSPESLQPGALQVRGENLLPLLWGLASAPELMTRQERKMGRWSTPTPTPYNRRNSSAPGYATHEEVWERDGGEPIFFDVFWEVMVGYSHRTAVALGTAVVGMVALQPLMGTRQSTGCRGPLGRLDQLLIGCLTYLASWILALAFPVALAVLRVWGTQKPMSWYSSPAWVFLAYQPISIVGMLLPHTLRAHLLNTHNSPYARERVEWSSHWGGVVGCNAIISLLITAAGYGGGYLMFWWAVFLTPSLWLSRRMQRVLGRDSPLCTLAFLVPSSVPSVYSLGFLQMTSRVLSEKMGQTGTHPLPIGLFIPDVIMAVVVGICGALCMAPYASAFSGWFCRANILRVLCYLSLLMSAQMSSRFPYSPLTPKRVVLARCYTTQGSETVLTAQTLVAAADANDASFVFKHAPEFRRAVLKSSPELRHLAGVDSWQDNGLPTGVYESSSSALLAQYPINDLLDRPAGVSAPLHQGSHSNKSFPVLTLLREERVPPVDTAERWRQRRRLHVHVTSGSLGEVWGVVLNFTGPLTGWSFADGKLPDPEVARTGGPLSYILHLGGGSGSMDWTFWVEASSTKELSVEMAVMDHRLDEDMAEIVKAAPDWMALYPLMSYTSTYRL